MRGETRMILGYLAIVLVTLPACIQGLRCYSCQSSGNLDPTCEKNPADVTNTPIVNCNKKYCTIFRQEFKDPKGRVNSFNRGCEEKPIYINNVITDLQWVSYYRSCTTDLCNSGTGVSSDGGSGGGGGWLDPGSGGSNDGGTLIVPGMGGSATSLGCNLVLAIAAGLVAILRLI